MTTIEQYFLFEDHKIQFFQLYNSVKDEMKTKVIQTWKNNYLCHLYIAESDKIMLKLNKNEVAEHEAWVLYGKRVPSLCRIHDVIQYWENV